MVKSKAELMEQIKTLVGNDTSDTSLELIANISDTIDDYESKVANNDGENWKKKFEENDAQWRQKYRDRFFSPVDSKQPADNPTQVEETDDTDEPKLKTDYNELFK